MVSLYRHRVAVTCSQSCHLVGFSQACRGVAGVLHSKHVWQFQKQSACWLQSEWRVECKNGSSPRRLSGPVTVHHRSGSPFSRVSYRMSLGKPVCLVIIFKSLEELQKKLILWMSDMEGKGPGVNICKTKVLISGPELNMFQNPAKKTLCHVSQGCWHKLHLLWRLLLDWSTRDTMVSLALWSPIPSPGSIDVLDWPNQYMEDQWQESQWEERSSRWHHLSATLGTAYSQVGAVNLCPSQDAVSHEANSMSSYFLLSFAITPKGWIYNSCIRSAMLHASETCAPTSPDLHRLQRNDRNMIPWMCGVTTRDQVSSKDPLKRTQFDVLAKILRIRKLRWPGHA